MKLQMIRTILSSVTEGVIKRFSGKGRPGETFTDREVFQHYGLTSRPLEGAEGILLKQGNNIILIASDDRRYRIAISDGEVALYTDEGDHIHMKRGRLIEVVTDTLKITAGTKVEMTTPLVEMIASSKVLMDTPLVETSGEVRAEQDITDSGGSGRSMRSMREKYNQHKHPEDASGDTEIPREQDQM